MAAAADTAITAPRTHLRDLAIADLEGVLAGAGAPNPALLARRLAVALHREGATSSDEAADVVATISTPNTSGAVS